MKAACGEIPKSLFKTLYDAQPAIMKRIIEENGRMTKYSTTVM